MILVLSPFQSGGQQMQVGDVQTRANAGPATSSAEVAVGRRERWARGQFERGVTKYSDEQ